MESKRQRPEYHDEKTRNRLFKNTRLDPVNGIRDHVILRLLYGAPVRPIEHCRLMTHDLVTDSGRITEDRFFEMREEVSFNGKSRPIPIANTELKKALQEWIDWRISNSWGVTKTGFIDLNAPFFMRSSTEGFKVVTTYSNQVPRHNSDMLNRVIRERLRANNIDGTVDSALRTWTLDRHREERCIRRIWAYRGDADIDTVRRVIGKDPVRLGALVEQVF